MSKIRVLCIENIAVEAAHRQIYRHLASQDDLDVHLLAPERWREAQSLVECEPERDSPLHVHQSKILFGFRQHRVLYRSLGKILTSLKPDFIFLDQEPENFAAIQGILFKRNYAPHAALALVSSRNIDHVKLGFPYQAEFIHRKCDEFVLRHPVDVCFVRTQAAEPLMRKYAKRIVHLPFPIDTTRLKRPDARREAQNQLTVGYVGRLVEQKGVRMLLELFPQLPEKINMMFVGKGPMRDELMQQAMKSTGRLRVLPPVPHKELAGVFSQMDVVVVPSLDTKLWKEQCPRVPMEAMACEVPVIGSDSGGIPEVLGDAGMIIQQADAIALRDAVDRVLREPALRESLARKGRQRVLDHFQVSVVASRMADVIRQTIQQKKD
ncbi:MAG: glycosyltransferase family 4 protein [Ignavibacteriae bacterium]|nr:glycosyltransferase family 4 protein [Ignavibacteriota bacterium]